MSSSPTPPLLFDQLDLSFAHDPALLRDRLECFTGQTIILKVTDNAAIMLSSKKKDYKTHIRLHRMFLHADETVLKAIAGFISGEKGHSPVIRNYIKENRSSLKDSAFVRPVLRSRGAIHCLRETFDRLNRTYFSGLISAGITWGRNRRQRGVRRITLGSYCTASNTIRINPRLDRKSVPLFFVEFIVYHEMLHAALGFSASSSRRLHTKGFRVREAQFADYDRAIAWEKKNL